MKNKSKKVNKKKLRKSPIFLIALFNFLIIILIAIYFIYLRFVPYKTITYDGYAVSGKDLVNNLLNPSFDVDQTVDALEVKDQDQIYQNLKSFYVGAAKEKNINLNYPIYVNDKLALYNLSKDMKLITTDLKTVDGYEGCTLTSGALYDEHTMERADYNDYILMKNSDSMYINTKEIKIKTYSNKYIIKMNSVINFTKGFITYYTLEDGKFLYGKILDIDESSTVEVSDFNCKYTYKELMIALGIMKEEVNTPEENIVEENKVEENKAEENKNEENKADEQKPNKKPETSKKPTNENGNDGNIVKWQKPKVSCTNFIANIYSASTEVTIDDPSGAISKAVTFSFYKDDELSFRASTNASETLKIIKLLPNTKYKVIGTYQYTDEKENVFEVKFTTQEFKTAKADKVNPIELSFKNGKIYSDKIELQNLKIISNIEDEAINGVTKAQIDINGVKYSIGTQTLLDILQGKEVVYQTNNVLKSNTKYKYEIIFYDTANNEMILKGNTGNTVTLKETPSVNLSLKAKDKDMVSNKITVQLVNEDDVQISNYRYELYDSNGELVKKNELDIKATYIFFDDLDPNSVYELKVKANYDIEDGNGVQKNQEIGYLQFTTSKLGKLFLNIKCDDDSIECFSANMKVSIDSEKTDSILLKILQNINIQIQRDDTKGIIQEFNLTGNEINKLAVESFDKELELLDSNTKYNIIVTATAKQGSVTEEIKTEGSISFETKKQPAQFLTKEVLVTNDMIELKAEVRDIDKACIGEEAELRLLEFEKDKGELENFEEGKEDAKYVRVTKKTISLNNEDIYTFNGLKKGHIYILEVYIDQYNETNNEKNLENKKLYKKIYNDKEEHIESYTTEGLSGKLDLDGITRKKKDEGKNLIDIESENNWYSQCFGVLNKGYKIVDGNIVFDGIKSTRNYGKTASVEENTSTLTLISNQCYVYNFNEYKGKTVTMSFKAKVSNDSIKNNIYIQKGKDIGKNIEKVEKLTTDIGDKIIYTTKIPDDGYLGFYLSADSKDTLTIQNLQVELGNEATDYEPYLYTVDLKAKANFEDERYQTNEEGKEVGYLYIRLKKDGIIQKKNENGEYEDYIGNEKYLGERYGTDKYGDAGNNKAKINLSYTLNIEKSATYTMEIVIAKYGREHILDVLELTYDPINCKEINVINNKQEFLNIQPKGNYFVSDDLTNAIDLTEAEEESQYTFGSPEISFYGSIDFNGKTILKDMKDSDIENEKKYTPYLFYRIEKGASLKNMVYDYKINNYKPRANDNMSELDGIYGLFLYNDGTIDNLMFTLKECKENDKKYIGLVGYENNGTIKKFIIKFNANLYGSKYINGICTNSYGTIENGYVYGLGIKTSGNIASTDTRFISGMIGTLKTGGVLKNVYNLASIYIKHQNNTNSFAANMVYTVEAGASISNIYSTEAITVEDGNKLLDQNQNEINNGPNVYEVKTGANAHFSYYFCNTTYENNEYNTKQSYTALNDYKFQNNLLNSDEAFEVEQSVENHYFPQLRLNKCMPYQDNLDIKDEDKIALNLISTEKIEYKNIDKDREIKDEEKIVASIKGKIKDEIEKMYDFNGENYTFTDDFNFDDNNIQIAKLSIYNPNGYGFNINNNAVSEEDDGIDIKSKYVDSKILDFIRKDNISYVYILLSNPTTYVNEYEFASIQGRNAENERVGEVKYGEGTELGKKTIKVSFTKHIYTAEEWHNINNNDQNGISGLIQNYKLYNDLDFEGKCYSNTESPYITGIFKGTLDGQNYTLSNIGDDGKPLFNRIVAGANLKNLKVKNYAQSKSSYAGVIGILGSTDSNKVTTINNIHIQDINLSDNKQYIGGLCAYMYGHNTNIQNCSVNNLTVTNPIGNERLNEDDAYFIGGIVGRIISQYDKPENNNINNCYATGLEIKTENVSINAYIGGIVGGAKDNNNISETNIKYCYTEGNVLSKQPYIGGICGNGGSIVNISNCYSLVEIKSEQNAGPQYIGGIVGINAKSIRNNLYAGRIITKYISSNVNRISGDTWKDTPQGNNNYGFANQLINGNVSEIKYGAKKLLSKDEIFTQEIWDSSENMNMGKDKNYYNYKDLIDEKLPRLYDTEGNILNEENQKQQGINAGIKASLQSSNYTNESTQAKIILKIEKDSDTVITDVEIENMKVEKPDSGFEYDTTTGTIEIIATPEKYYDSYTLKKVKYKNKSDEKEQELGVDFIVSLKFYKLINSVYDWNESVKDNDEQNYKLTKDLNFKDNNGNSLLTEEGYNKKIGRLISSDKQPKTISGINLTLNNSQSGFINQIVKEMSNINFYDCTIKANGSDNGLIYMNNGTINKCDFNSINIYGESKDYIGIIARFSKFASIDTANLTNINVTGRNYIGGLCGHITSSSVSGIVRNIKGSNIKINATGSCIGGIIGSTSIGVVNIKVEGSYIKGNNYTGGCIGESMSAAEQITVENSEIHGSERGTGGCLGRKYYGKCENVNSYYNKIYADGTFSDDKNQGVGGCIGFLYINGMTNKMESKGNTISGINSNNERIHYVGGNVGVLWAYDNVKFYNTTSSDNTIIGKNNVGGIVGEARRYYSNSRLAEGIIEKAYSKDNELDATGNNVGGCVGSSQLRMRNMKTIYTEESSVPQIKGTSCVGGIVGKATYSNINDSSTYYYTIDCAYVNNANISASIGYVGGISGNQMGTVYGGAVSNTIINTEGESAGGIVGYYTASDKANASYIASERIYIIHSFCVDSEVNSLSNAGGIAGKMIYGNIKYCYVGRTNISATGNNAGGIIGYIANDDMTDKQYKAIVKYNYIINTNENKSVKSSINAGGLIGKIDLSYISKELENDYSLIENYITNNLVLTNINGSQASMTIGQQAGNKEHKDNIRNTYVYKYSKMNDVYIKDTQEGKRNIYELVDSSKLNDITNTSIYKDSNKLNLGTTRFDYTSGIFPKLKPLSSSSTQTYWNASNLNVVQPDIQIPEDPDETSATSLQSSTMLNNMMLSSGNIELPEIYTYAVDVDKINIEFSDVNSNMKFDIKTNDGKNVLESTTINKKVYTLNYDFNTPITVTISNGTKWFTKEITPKDVQNVIQIINDEYFYIAENKLHSNKRAFEGEYLNIYNGKGLTSNGKIYNISDMSLVGDLNKEIKVLNKEIPISETEYEGTNIKTFYHCSKISEKDEEIYKDKQIFIKNGMMYLADGSLNSKGNAIIIDSYNENQYETILGTDGVIYDLLTKVKYPVNFKNKDIIAMSNNINNNDEIILVYYSNGRVYAFNYVTGEEVFDNNVGKDDMSLVSYIIDNLNVTKTLYKTDKSNYAEAKKLTNKLETVAIENAVIEIKEGRKKNEKVSKNKKDTDTKYVTSYNADTQTYNVYSAKEILGKETSKVISENDKINKDNDLVEYYENISTGTVKLKGIGIIVFAITLTSICVILIVMNRKSRKLNK